MEDKVEPTTTPAKVSPRRAELVQKAVKEWVSTLVDLGGRNNLIHYRSLRLGTLDLTDANHVALAALLRGKTVTLASLFPHSPSQPGNGEDYGQILRRVRAIHDKAKENFEERGLATLSLGCGLATWENKRSTWTPSAPVLLRAATVRPLGAAQDSFELSLTDEMEVNPSLLQVLKTDFDCEFDHEALLERIDGAIDEPWELHEAYTWLKKQADRVPGLQIDPRVVLTNFAYAKLPMVRDLEQALDQLTQHPLIAALAGDEDCRQAIRDAGPGPDAVPSPDDQPLADEFIVLDADSSQNYAINSVIRGQSLIVKGPPGTGKSQTIANLIASLIARGQKVLFVAEKAAAIEAVTKRLHQQGLEQLVLDLHGAISTKKEFAQTVGRALEASRLAPTVVNGAELRDLERQRAGLNMYVRSLHTKREPWDISVYAIRAELIGLAAFYTDVRLRGQELDGIGGVAVQTFQDEAAEFASLGGFTMVADELPWSGSPIISAEEARQAYELVGDLRRHGLPTVLALLTRAHQADDTLALPISLSEWSRRVSLWQDELAALSVFTPSVFGQDLAAVLVGFAPANLRGWARFQASITSPSFRRSRKALRAAQRPGLTVTPSQVYLACEAALTAQNTLASLGVRTVGMVPESAPACKTALEHLAAQVTQLEHWVGVPGLADMPVQDLTDWLDRLASDQLTLVKLPRLRQLEASMRAAGLTDFLDEMTSRRASPAFTSSSLRSMWLHSVLDCVTVSDSAIGAFVADKHEAVVTAFQEGDHRHIKTTAARIMRICAEAATQVRDRYPEQGALVAHQAALKRRHLPIRDFVRHAPDVLLALKPCWAMSPLMVSQILPSETYFDVVIFDEASQVTPSDAIPSILRGRQLVVAGDEHQLPPTAFFVSEEQDEEDDEPQAEEVAGILAGTKGFESILQALDFLLRYRTLLWHYRSRDERLIAFSNAHIYDRMLVTFAGVGNTEILRFVMAPWDPSADTNSPMPEVDRVVDLVFEHAQARPSESLGVIAMGVKHADRIRERYRQRLASDPKLGAHLREFFNESLEEHFFVKNLERVQGDERDAIILSVGYGKNARGDLPYRFGALLTDGGARRLNVAVTRAKIRATLVASFSYLDMDPERSDAEGVKLLRQYLQYVESDGRNLGDIILERPALNPFEIDVRDTLMREGVKLTAQYGSSGYWIDFAVHHPTQPGKYVLAIECDGATYHSSESARDRDRLRQEQLERIGWRFHRIWSSEWFYNKQAAVAKVMAAYRDAITRSDSGVGSAPASSAGVWDNPSPSASVGRARGGRQLERPYMLPGQPIVAYGDADLIQVIDWIESDQHLRTEEEVLQEALTVLGFHRRGRIVVSRLTEAIRRSRQARPKQSE